MKVRIKVQPTGLYNGAPWPKAGEVIDLPKQVAVGMLQSKLVEPLKVSNVEMAVPKVEQETAAPKTGRRGAKQVAAAPAENTADEKPAADETAAEAAQE